MAKKQQPSIQSPQLDSKTSSPKKILMAAVGVLTLIIVAVGAYFLYSKQQADKKLSSTQLDAKEVETLIEKVGKLIELPQGETPTVATVSDINKLKGQAFFKNAQNGDKVLIYQKSRKAYLYRPSINKVIEVGPVNFAPTPAVQQSQQQSSTESATTEDITVTVLNGTTTSGLGGQTKNKLTAKYPNVTVGRVGNAAKTDYTGTLIVDISGKNKEFAVEIAKFLGGQVGPLPEGESKPNTDLLVITAK